MEVSLWGDLAREAIGESQSSHHAAFGGFDEADQVGDVGVVRVVGGFEGADGVGEVAVFFEEEFFVSRLDGADVFFGKAAALQAHEVDAAGGGRVAIHDHEGGHILHYFGTSANDRVGTKAAELVCGGEAGNDDVVLDDDMSGEADGIGKDDVIAELAIVGHVRITEQQVVGTDACRQILVGAAVNCGVFTKHIVVADFEIGGLADVFEVLGFSTDGSEGEKLISLADLRVALDDDVRVEHAFIAEFDLRADHAKRTNPDLVANPGVGRNDSSRVDHAGNVSGGRGI